MKMNNGCGDIRPHAVALVAILCLSFLFLALPYAVHASPSSSSRSSDSAPQGYRDMGNGVFESTFARNVPGIQEATHLILRMAAGPATGGWI
ncbi:MAG TPA: hypothetical protein VLV18_08270 [Terriglobales bacterium]|nr:hypothetical protein [Terriglobales bacterium]